MATFLLQFIRNLSFNGPQMLLLVRLYVTHARPRFDSNLHYPVPVRIDHLDRFPVDYGLNAVDDLSDDGQIACV